jgi:lipoprotein NlpD
MVLARQAHRSLFSGQRVFAWNAARRWSRRIASVLFLLAFLGAQLQLVGCGTREPAPVDSRDGSGPVPAGQYRVRDGDTLYSIAFRRGIDFKSLAQWNRIPPPYRIYAGKLIRVEPPHGQGGKVSATESQPKKAGVSSRAAAPASPKVAAAKPAVAGTSAQASTSKKSGSGLKWQWPIKGRVVQGFRRGDRTRQGIRISGRAGQQVNAAGSGTVVYSGSGLKGYGNLIIVKHDNNYLSAYGFNRRLLVSEGQRVKRGQGVAEVGKATSGEYLLHFEIRRNGIAEDPLKYLTGTH